MKKIIAIISIVLVGCESKDLVTHKTHRNQGWNDYNGCISTTEPDETYIIDSCEYIVIGAGHIQMMSHKGNCKNKIHVYNK